MSVYFITYDKRIQSLFDQPAYLEIQATSPKQAAEKYVHGKVVRNTGLAADIVVKSSLWPFKTFLYDIERIK